MNDMEGDMKIRKGMYQHYKGKLYHVKGVATHSETREPMVLYIPLYVPEGQEKAELTTRPAYGPEGFFEEVDEPEYKWKGSRFKFLHEYDDDSLERSQ